VKIGIFELWGLGDAAICTAAIRALVQQGHDVSLVAKQGSVDLLSPSYPSVHFIPFNAPWTAFSGKYRFWEWNWPQIVRTVLEIRRFKPDVVLSVRQDPRDHFLMWLSGARRRPGFPSHGSRIFLTQTVKRPFLNHKVEDWRLLLKTLGVSGADLAAPFLRCDQPKPQFGTFGNTPYMVVHQGAQQRVRRWPDSYFSELVTALRSEFPDYHWIAIPEPGVSISDASGVYDSILHPKCIQDLTKLLGGASFVLANDSGPAHIAASMGVPVIAFFGPQRPEWFRPFGDHGYAIARDLCSERPCFDACKFSEPFCLTKLTPGLVMEEVTAIMKQNLTN